MNNGALTSTQLRPGVAKNELGGGARKALRPSPQARGARRLLIIEGTIARCGISMKGIDIVVGGSVGDYSASLRRRRLGGGGRRCDAPAFLYER